MKYKLTEETQRYYGRDLYRIQALKDFGDVKAGELGGWVEKESNLSQEGYCWVYNEAKVYGDAQVLGNALVSENARVYGNARIYDDVEIYGNAVISDNVRIYGDVLIYGNARVFRDAVVSGDVQIYDNARVGGNARISDEAYIYGNANICGKAEVCEKADVYDNVHVFGNVKVMGHAQLYGRVEISGNALIKSCKDYCSFQSFGSQNRITTFYRDSNGDIFVECGCFQGNLKEFEAKVRETHGHNKFGREYLKIIEVVKIKFEEPNNKLQSVFNRIKRKVAFFNKMFKFKNKL